MIPTLLLVMLICMVGHAMFAGIETGVISIHRMRLRHFVRKGSANALILESFLTNFDRLLGTTLVGTNICLVVLSVVGASLALRLDIPGGEGASSALLTLLVVVFAEYLPKAWFHSRPLERCVRFAGVLRISEIILMPVSFAVLGVTRLISPGNKDPFTKPDPFVTREDLKLLAREGEQDGVLTTKERYMIHRVIEMSGKKAADIMVPRDEMVVAYGDMKVPEFYELARESGFTRFPVVSRESGDFIGIINVFYLLSAREVRPDRRVADFVRPPQLIDAKMPVDDILPRMRRGRQPLCLVRREEKVVGLVTTEDVLRSIVGKL